MTVAGASLSVVTVSLAVMEIVNGRCEGTLHELPAGGHDPPTHPESRSSSQKEKSPAWVGVPVTCPFESIDRPVGSDPD